MTFCFHQGGVVPYTRHLRLGIINYAFFIFYSNRIMKRHPTPASPGYKPLKHGRAVRKKTRNKQKWPRETQSSTYAPGLSTPFYLSRSIVHPPPSFTCFPMPPALYPSNIISIYPCISIKYDSSKSIKVTFESQHLTSQVLTKGFLLFTLSHQAQNICKEIFVEIFNLLQMLSARRSPHIVMPKVKGL